MILEASGSKEAFWSAARSSSRPMKGVDGWSGESRPRGGLGGLARLAGAGTGSALPLRLDSTKGLVLERMSKGGLIRTFAHHHMTNGGCTLQPGRRVDHIARHRALAPLRAGALRVTTASPDSMPIRTRRSTARVGFVQLGDRLQDPLTPL